MGKVRSEKQKQVLKQKIENNNDLKAFVIVRMLSPELKNKAINHLRALIHAQASEP